MGTPTQAEYSIPWLSNSNVGPRKSTMEIKL